MKSFPSNVLQKRQVLEENNQLEPRISALDDDLEEMEEEEDLEHKVSGSQKECGSSPGYYSYNIH